MGWGEAAPHLARIVKVLEFFRKNIYCFQG